MKDLVRALMFVRRRTSVDVQKRPWRNGRDLNPRGVNPSAFKADAFGRSATVPGSNLSWRKRGRRPTLQSGGDELKSERVELEKNLGHPDLLELCDLATLHSHQERVAGEAEVARPQHFLQKLCCRQSGTSPPLAQSIVLRNRCTQSSASRQRASACSRVVLACSPAAG